MNRHSGIGCWLTMVLVLFAVGAPAKEKRLPLAESHALSLVAEGRKTFRYDTFGDEAFWSGQLGLDDLVKATSPRQALALGLALTENERRDLVEYLKSL